MKEKKFELCGLIGKPGNYKAVLYNRLGGYYKEVYFLWYSKKEIAKILRRDYDCIVRKGTI